MKHISSQVKHSVANIDMIMMMMMVTIYDKMMMMMMVMEIYDSMVMMVMDKDNSPSHMTVAVERV